MGKQMSATPCEMSAATHEMSAALRVMLAATHLMFVKDQKGGLDVPPRPKGAPPTPIHEKTLVSRNDF